MKRILLLIFLITIFPQHAFSQCDDFSKAILTIVKTASYQDFKQYFEPNEAKRTRMQWPDSEDATNYLNTLNDSLYKKLVASIKQFEAEYKKHGWDLAKASYVSCQRTSGVSSAIKINFKILNRDESFIIKTHEGDRIYITSPLIDGKKGYVTPVKSYTVIDNKQYTTFKPRKDELSKGVLHLKRFLEEEGITDYRQHCTLGLNDMYGGVFLEFLVMGDDGNQYFLADLATGHCKEVFK